MVEAVRRTPRVTWRGARGRVRGTEGRPWVALLVMKLVMKLVMAPGKVSTVSGSPVKRTSRAPRRMSGTVERRGTPAVHVV